MRTFLQIGLAVLVIGICIACSTRNTVPSNNLSSMPEPTLKNILSEPVNSLVQTSSPITITPSITLTVSGNSSSVSDFPLTLGNTWIYSSTRYEGYEGPHLMTATYIITERVVETQASPPYFVAKIHREEKLLTASAQWGGSEEWGQDYWRIISGTHVYRQGLKLDLSDQESFQLEYTFPLSTTKSWCPAKKIPEEDCIASGKRTVIKAATRSVPAGDFETCYEIVEDFTTGTYNHWFCPRAVQF